MGSDVITLIPPGEVRQVRPCGFSCDDDNDICIWFFLCTRHVHMDHCKRRDLHDLTPCKYHITSDEVVTLIDQHNAGEQPHYYGPSEIADLIAEEDRQQSRQEGD